MLIGRFHLGIFSGRCFRFICPGYDLTSYGTDSAKLNRPGFVEAVWFKLKRQVRFFDRAAANSVPQLRPAGCTQWAPAVGCD